MSPSSDLIQALREVDGVAQASIVDDPNGVGTLRLALRDDADEISVAMEVNKVLRERFGLGVDPDRVEVIDDIWPDEVDSKERDEIQRREVEFRDVAFRSPVKPDSLLPPVAALPDLKEAAAPRIQIFAPSKVVPTGRRLSIRRLQLVSSLESLSTTVTLGMGSDIYVGRAQASLDLESIHQAVALATLDAVGKYVGNLARIEIEQVSVCPLGDESVALVVLRLFEDSTMHRLTGASVVRQDVRQAIVRASLDAVNRRLEILMGSKRP
ncbi:unannotated protein [freshwater metagenome]|uniref:Unannotated protein n=1 Tax=freshwater metagenome TaxID=449393 RepID=A0A6J7DTW6_9ZZZZ|nr:hypothetical protein [Actinomycetota bacterium]